jgi:hypothetical protein
MLVPTFADRGRHVVSVTNPYDRILGFLDRDCSDMDKENGESPESVDVTAHAHVRTAAG